MTPNRTGLAGALALALAALAGVSPAAHAQTCPLVPAGLSCAPLPDNAARRHDALQALDDAGRASAARGDYPAAARAFGCLVEDDPTPGSAGNLAVVLREQGLLGDALLAARCAERLATDDPGRERARVRREEIERRLGLAPEPPAPAAGVLLPAPAPPPAVEPPRPRRAWGYAALAGGAAAGFGAGVLYLLARDRSRQFDDEQLATGFSPRARDLRDSAATLETWSWVGVGAGLALALTGVALLRF
jgi:hypothetical protein